MKGMTKVLIEYSNLLVDFQKFIKQFWC